MFDRLADIEQKYMDLAEQINDPDVIANQTEWRRLMKEYSDMTPVVEKYREYRKTRAAIAEETELLGEKLEEDFRELVKEELAGNKERLESLKTEISGKEIMVYDKHCLHLSKEEVEANLAAGKPYVIRQNVPREGTTSRLGRAETASPAGSNSS